MENFTEAIKYPDGRNPSFGNSFRRVNDKKFVDTFKETRNFNPDLFNFTDSGYFIAQGGNNNAWKLLFFAPSKSITHKHEDNLNLTFWANGVEWLIDPGFYSFDYDNPLARYAKSMKAHNIPFVDHRKYSLKPGLAKISLISRQNSKFQVRGISNSLENTKIIREIYGNLNSNTVQIEDQILTELMSNEKIVFPLHFGERVSVELKDSKAILSSALVQSSVTLSW
jgi:hypothetical protein